MTFVSTFKAAARNRPRPAEGWAGSGAWGGLPPRRLPGGRDQLSPRGRGCPPREEHVLTLITLVIRAQVFEPQPRSYPSPGSQMIRGWA